MMLRLLLILFVISIVINVQAKGPAYAPYSQAVSNTRYNQLFCDNLASYQNEKNSEAGQAWQLLFEKPVDVINLSKIAKTENIDSRQRLLAFHLLRQHNVKPEKKILLGVIVEVGFKEGVDTLAAYRDLHVQYIYRSGKLRTIVKPDTAVTATVRKLFQESQPIIEKIKPWSKRRLPPPSAGMVRLTFLVSDGLYFGQGSMTHLARSPLAGPVLTAATELLFKVTRH